MRILWGRADSANVMKVAWLLAELGLPYERREAGGRHGVVDTPSYRAMNPNGRVPVLQEDGFTLFESNAILRYLCTAQAQDTQTRDSQAPGNRPPDSPLPNSPLWPADARARADVDRWMDWQQTRLNPPITTVFQGLVRTPPERRDAIAIATGTTESAVVWSLLDAQLAGRDFVTGCQMTLADMAIGPFVHRWFNMPVVRPEAPHLRAWYERLLERPAYRTHAAGPVV